MKSAVPSVVATADVKVGKVLAVEEAFAAFTQSQHKAAVCCYCQKFSLNLFSCKQCCSVMFCSSQCHKACLDEYHRIICPVSRVLENIEISWLAVVSAIKLRSRFKDWDTFNEATLRYGLKRIKDSDINEIFDGSKAASMLNFRDDSVFVYGKMYKASIGCAVLLHNLSCLGTYFPSREKDREVAMRALARTILYFCLHATHTPIISAVSILGMNMTLVMKPFTMGMFPFIGKLKTACLPNVLALGLKNKIALVAIQPIKAGTELTFSPWFDWQEYKMSDTAARFRALLGFNMRVCTCALCTGAYKKPTSFPQLTERQLRYYRKYNIEAVTIFGGAVPNLYAKCSKALAFLSESPDSEEYKLTYALFREVLLAMQDNYTQNMNLDLK